MKKGLVLGVSEPFVGQGIIINKGVLVGVTSAVGVEDG